MLMGPSLSYTRLPIVDHIGDGVEWINLIQHLALDRRRSNLSYTHAPNQVAIEPLGSWVRLSVALGSPAKSD